MINDFIEKNIDNLISDLGKLVSHNSVLCDDEAPFGSENRKVLDDALLLMKQKNFNTKNLDYYCGYGEVGDGKELVGIVTHLDIVPATGDWNTNPFELTVKDNIVYGRGVGDDKGAAVCSMYALKYLLDSGYQFKKRFRLIVGCNEETGSKCMDHYNEVEEELSMGFTPDAEFPGIYAEKGMVGASLVGKSKIIDIKGGAASNIVCDKVEAKLNHNDYDSNKLDEYFKKNNIKYTLNGDDLTVFGSSAHASTPEKGINAINHLFLALEYANFDDEYTHNIVKWFGNTVNGELIGLDTLKDSESNTTTNLGVISEKDNIITCSLDIRFPVKTTSSKCKELLDKMNNGSFNITDYSLVEPLYFDKNTPWIKALKKAYIDVTHDTDSDLLAIGGGTYAKHVKNIIAFGCEFNDYNSHIHEPNESVRIEDLKKQVQIYIEAIKNLNEV